MQGKGEGSHSGKGERHAFAWRGCGRSTVGNNEENKKKGATSRGTAGEKKKNWGRKPLPLMCENDYAVSKITRPIWEGERLTARVRKGHLGEGLRQKTKPL